MTATLIQDATLVLVDRLVQHQSLAIEGGRIAAFGPADDFRPGDFPEIVPADGAYLAPGFVDLHVHGTHRFLIDNGPADLEALCRVLPRYGVTGFLATVCPRPAGEDAAFLAKLSGVRSEGASILGFHLEGPFLTLTGALPPEALGKSDPGRVRALQAAAGAQATIFSVAPDFEGIMDLIPLMAKGGRPVFMTHTAASVEQTQAAIEAGVRHATHFYDVFPVPPQTEPGVRPAGTVEAILADERVTVDFILDGEHVHPVAVKMALQCKGPGGVCLITDANVGAGLPPGRHKFFQEEVEFRYEGGPARLTEKARFPGVLAGSGLTMIRAVANAVKLLGVPLYQAIRMASTNPVAVLGGVPIPIPTYVGTRLGTPPDDPDVHRGTGRIEKGLDADLALLDSSLRVRQTWVRGRCCYDGQDFPAGPTGGRA